MSNHVQPTVAVIGGGVIGVSSACHLARSGAKVYLVTAAALGSGASGRSLSWINAAGIRSENYHQFRMAGIDRYRTLLAREPALGWLRFDGGLRWQRPGESNLLGEIHAHEVAHGYDSRVLTPDDIRARMSGVDESAVPASGAIWNPGEGWVDLPSLINDLANELVHLGGTLVTHAGEASVTVRAGCVTAIKTENHGAIAVQAALLATGSNVPKMASEFGITIPDATTTALLINTRPLQSPLRVVLNTPRVSLRPTPNGALAVDADWAESRIERRADGTYDVGAETIKELLVEASRVLAGRPQLAAATYGIGPKPIPGDGEPVLGQLGDISGLYVAFTHSGATLALIIGELLAYEIMTGRSHPLLAPFAASRFGAG